MMEIAQLALKLCLYILKGYAGNKSQTAPSATFQRGRTAAMTRWGRTGGTSRRAPFVLMLAWLMYAILRKRFLPRFFYGSDRRRVLSVLLCNLIEFRTPVIPTKQKVMALNFGSRTAPYRRWRLNSRLTWLLRTLPCAIGHSHQQHHNDTHPLRHLSNMLSSRFITRAIRPSTRTLRSTTLAAIPQPALRSRTYASSPTPNSFPQLPPGFEKLAHSPSALTAISNLVEVMKQNGVDLHTGEKPSMWQMVKLARNQEVRDATTKGEHTSSH